MPTKKDLILKRISLTADWRTINFQTKLRFILKCRVAEPHKSVCS